MHTLSTSFVLGYHGCSKAVAESLLSGVPFKRSNNEYDWLGPGIYFWEANPRRGYEFYRDVQRRNKGDVEDVQVVGAVVDMGFCLDLTTSAGVDSLSIAYESLKEVFDAAGQPMPENTLGRDKLWRNLDCAVIRFLHESRATEKLPPFDVVKGVFQEGDPAYPGSGVKARTHIQLAVCDPAKIKGVFRVSEADYL